MKTYLIDTHLRQLLVTAQVSPEATLKKASLPADLLNRKTASVTGQEFLNFMQAMQELSPVKNLALNLATAERIEQFNPPIFAAYCSQNGLNCIERLGKYKSLIGPIRYRLETLGKESTLYIEAEEIDIPLPTFLVEGELIFILHILRSATKTNIIPIKVESTQKLSPALESFAEISVARNGINAITFHLADLQSPFISHNEEMWEYFEPELKRRLSQLDTDDSTSARVRALLVESLPSGESSIEDAARKLCTSSRTLQRQLAKENTSFREQLNYVRFQLAKQYLSTSDMSMDSISFMLGYVETQSFVRAFELWRGVSPQAYRVEKSART